MPKSPEEKRAYQKAYRERNKEKRNAEYRKWYATHGAAYREKNKEKIAARHRVWHTENGAQYQQARRDSYANDPAYRYMVQGRNRRGAAELLPSHIARLFGVSVKVIPPALIEAKRMQLLIKRKLNEKRI